MVQSLISIQNHCFYKFQIHLPSIEHLLRHFSRKNSQNQHFEISCFFTNGDDKFVHRINHMTKRFFKIIDLTVICPSQLLHFIIMAQLYLIY